MTELKFLGTIPLTNAYKWDIISVTGE